MVWGVVHRCICGGLAHNAQIDQYTPALPSLIQPLPNLPEEVVEHEEERGDQHEGVAHPQRVREAPQALPHHLRVPVVCGYGSV